MTDYKIVQIIDQNTVVLESKYGTQIWTIVTLRKDNICEQTKIVLQKGVKAYKPNTNGYNRSHRISVIAMGNLKELYK